MSNTKIYTQRMGVNLWQEVALRPAGDELVFAVKGDCGGFVAQADVRLSRRGVEELILGLESWLQEQDTQKEDQPRLVDWKDVQEGMFIEDPAMAGNYLAYVATDEPDLLESAIEDVATALRKRAAQSGGPHA